MLHGAWGKGEGELREAQDWKADSPVVGRQAPRDCCQGQKERSSQLYPPACGMSAESR